MRTIPDAANTEAQEMTIKAYITLANNEIIPRDFTSWEDLGAWIERHHDHIKEVSAEQVKPSEIRQGKK